MPLDISTEAIKKKNLQNSNEKWILLLKMDWPGDNPDHQDPGYLCLNNKEITWQNQVWSPAIFSMSGLHETKDAEVPEISLGIYDLKDKIIPIIDALDGGVGAEITVYVVHESLLSSDDPELEEKMEVVDTSFDDNRKVTVKLGAENLNDRRCPQNRYLKNQCRFTFKGSDGRCGYTGAEATCNRTLARCRELGNSVRYGGFPGVGGLGLKV